MNAIVENLITEQLKGKAEELGIEFEVKHTLYNDQDEIVISIKSEHPEPTEKSSEEELELFNKQLARNYEFAKYAGDIIAANQYAKQIRYTYPSSL